MTETLSKDIDREPFRARQGRYSLEYTPKAWDFFREGGGPALLRRDPKGQIRIYYLGDFFPADPKHGICDCRNERDTEDDLLWLNLLALDQCFYHWVDKYREACYANLSQQTADDHK